MRFILFGWGHLVKTTRLAPAKVNLCLHVLGRRADGYHELAMLMQRVSLYDRIAAELTAKPGVRVCCQGVTLAPGEENIAGRAAAMMLEQADCGGGVDLVIEKKIPVAAGLGGGSSDAATVLLALNEMLDVGLSVERLMELGVQLGADVPFFVFEEAAWATGIGERLEKAAGLPPVWYVLVNPGFSVSTAWVYRKLGLTLPGDVARLPRFPGTIRELVGQLHNDLECVTLVEFPVVAEIKEVLSGLGALGVLMSGSGPTVFGVFATEAAARKAEAQLLKVSGWNVFAVQPV
jgi:4-diphosphocytidyl-2-C-methyl-D-erythritol kinase